MNNEKKINDGGQAFPVACVTQNLSDGVYCHTGMSLRDWFAGQAVSALLANLYPPTYAPALAIAAYAVADEMIKHRSK